MRECTFSHICISHSASGFFTYFQFEFIITNTLVNDAATKVKCGILRQKMSSLCAVVIMAECTHRIGQSTIDLIFSNAHRIWFNERISFDCGIHFPPVPSGDCQPIFNARADTQQHQHPQHECYAPGCGHICCMHAFNNIMHALFESNIILKRLAGIMLNRAIILLSAFPSSYGHIHSGCGHELQSVVAKLAHYYMYYVLESVRSLCLKFDVLKMHQKSF